MTGQIADPRPLTRGIHAATTLPYTREGEIDEASFLRQLAFIFAEPGMTGLLVNGHAGENQLTSDAEKARVIQMARRAAPPDVVIVTGVYSESSAMAATQARMLQEAGADALLLFPPFAWSLGPETASVLAHHRAVISASRLPVLLYQSPVGAARLSYSDDLIGELLRFDQVAGVKDGSWEIARSERLRDAVKARRPEVVVYGSGDEHLMVNYLIGTEGSQVSLASVIPQTVCGLWSAARDGDWARARALHEKIQPLARLIYSADPASRSVARLKACQKILGVIDDAGVRSPLIEAPAEEYARLERALACCM